ncbi:MAG: DUF2807 domain-containing protein [Prevotellaceae bacterium]|nr:DUF2807 domain-containing protein [Prevotellaceae bacterium]
MKNLLNINVLVIVFSLFSCISFARRADLVKKELDLPQVTALEISSVFKVYIKQGDTQNIVLEADDDVIPYVVTEVKNGKLKVYISKKIKWITSSNKLYITVQTLDKIKVAGASSIVFDNGFSANNIKMEVAGASFITGKLEINDVDIKIAGASKAELEIFANQAAISVKGASSVVLSGEANTQKIEATGMSKIDAENFKGDSAEVQATGMSKVTVGAKNLSQLRSVGASSIIKK